jgi:F-type H+-transporting ATPase subunit epsilon
MYERSFQLEIVAPNRLVFEGEASSVSAPGTLGGFQVLFNHAPLLSSLEVGPLKFKNPAGVDTVYATGGGFLEVRDNRVTVLVESAELPEEIDIERARSARERAEGRLRSREQSLDMVRAELALARALNRLRLAGRH